MHIYINDHLVSDKQIKNTLKKMWESLGYRSVMRFLLSLLTFMVTGDRRSCNWGIYLEQLLWLWEGTRVCGYKHIAHILIQVKICIYCVLRLFEARLALRRTSIEKSCLQQQERRSILHLLWFNYLFFISGIIPLAMVLACSIFYRPP